MPIKGVTGSLDIVDGKLIIIHKTLLAKPVEKVIPLNQITSISFARAGMMSNGYIRFSFRGGQEFKAGPRYNPVSDENAIAFKRQQEEAFRGMKDYIEQVMSSNPQQ